MNKLWTGIYGQLPVIQALERLIDASRIPHAFLFQGIDGVGKDFVANRFAQVLNAKFIDADSVGKVTGSIENYSEPYIKYIFPLPRGRNENENSGPTEKLSNDELQTVKEEIGKKINNPYYKISIPKASNIKISSIRDIKKFLSLNFSDIMFRIILISGAHLMNEEAQNALLKNLEEPPEGVIFILTTPYPVLLRETIRSRCWTVNFQPLSDEDISEILVKHYELDPVLARKIAPFAQGSVTTALKLLEHNFEDLLEKTIFILRYSFGRKYHSAISQFSELLSDGNTDTLRLLISMIITWLNDYQKYRISGEKYFFSEYVETLEKFNKRFPDIELNNAVSNIDRLSSMLQSYINPNLIILNIVYELSSLVSDIG